MLPERAISFPREFPQTSKSVSAAEIKKETLVTFGGETHSFNNLFRNVFSIDHVILVDAVQ